jgi:TPR repeat protein/tRNA A-37 threonylcarbamoyl transferase component Bud32
MIGQVVSSYRIASVIGEGGMGIVYLGQHTLLARQAAIKVLLPEYSRDQDMVRRFFNEARAANAIRHPGIVEIHDFGFAEDGSAFIIMELLEGESLQQRIDESRGQRGWLPPASAVLIARQIAGALGAAHRASIVHRDLKPDNVYLIRDPEVPGGERIKLLDFGIAKLGDRSQVSAHERTRTGVIMGTPTYMAPEQCRGTGDVDHRADLYALGCILYRMLCGRAPFAGMGQGETLAAHLHLPVERPRALVPGLPADLEALVLRLLEKDPARRHQSTDELIADLDRLSAIGLASQPPRLASDGGHALSTLSYAATLHASGVTRQRDVPGRGRARVLGVVAAFAVVGAGVAALVITSRGPGGHGRADAGVAVLARDAATVSQDPPDAASAAAWVAVTEAQCQPALAHVASVMAGAELDSASAPYRYYARYLDTPDEAARMVADCAESYDAEALACLARVRAPADVVACASALADRQCRHGDQVGCVSVAARLHADGQHDQAAGHAQDACQSGVSAGCTLLGTMHYYGRGATLDLDAARRLFERGHALGDPDAGSALADMLHRGIGGRRDPAGARSLYQQVCDEQPAHGACVGLGELEERGIGGRSSRRAAVERYRAACDRDSARGCALLAAHVSGNEAEALYTRARALYELGAAHAPRSAFHLAELMRDGEGGHRDPAGAAGLLARACTENEPLACEASGDLHVSGKIAIDLGRSRQAYERACAAGIERACQGVECHALLARSDQSGDWAERITECRERGLLPRTRRPVTPPRRAPDSARPAGRASESALEPGE